MTQSEDQMARLEQALKDAHRQRETPALSAHWQTGLMRAIRRQPASRAPGMDATRLIWRAAAVIALVSALLAGSALTWSPDADDAEAALWADAGLLGDP
jgi:hypothetical protein